MVDMQSRGMMELPQLVPTNQNPFILSAAEREWRRLAKLFQVKSCELQIAILSLDDEFKGTMTDFAIAEAFASDPEYIKNVRQWIYDQKVQCEDKGENLPPLGDLLKAKLVKDDPATAGFLALPGKNLRGVRIKGGGKTSAQIVLEYGAAKLSGSKKQKQALNKAKQKAAEVQKEELKQKALGLNPLFLVAIAAGAFFLLRR